MYVATVISHMSIHSLHSSIPHLEQRKEIWEKCLTMCCKLMSTYASVLSGVKDASILRELVNSEAGVNRLRGTDILHIPIRLIEHGDGTGAAGTMVDSFILPFHSTFMWGEGLNYSCSCLHFGYSTVYQSTLPRTLCPMAIILCSLLQVPVRCTKLLRGFTVLPCPLTKVSMRYTSQSKLNDQLL